MSRISVSTRLQKTLSQQDLLILAVVISLSIITVYDCMAKQIVFTNTFLRSCCIGAAILPFAILILIKAYDVTIIPSRRDIPVIQASSLLHPQARVSISGNAARVSEILEMAVELQGCFVDSKLINKQCATLILFSVVCSIAFQSLINFNFTIVTIASWIMLLVGLLIERVFGVKVACSPGHVFVFGATPQRFYELDSIVMEIHCGKNCIRIDGDGLSGLSLVFDEMNASRYLVAALIGASLGTDGTQFLNSQLLLQQINGSRDEKASERVSG